MAEGGATPTFAEGCYDDNLQDQKDEVMALQSIYEGGDVERLRILSSPSEDKQGLYTLHLTVPVHGEREVTKVDILMPAKSETASATPVEVPPVGKGVNFVRSDSGQRWVGSFNVKFLSPLNLQIVLPPTYPSQSAPVFTLSCVWLTTNQLSSLCKQLHQIWLESENLPVIFTWVDWLENNVLSHLCVESSVLLMPVQEDEESGDDRALSECTDLGQAVSRMLQYNRFFCDLDFYRSNHDCHICYEELPGNAFFRLNDCEHHYCHDCMTAYCEHHVGLGTVENLRCPDTECDSIIPPHIVQSVLPADEFHRWERLMLQKTLESMTDMEWCPRCNNPVIREAEENLNLGHCTTCFFSFCTECRDPWHQGRSCISTADKLAAVSAGVDPEYDWEKFGEQRRKLEEEFRSELSMQEKVKKCPSCHIKIEKINGCNRMVCKCGTMFCWLCLSVIEGYNHFQMGASLCRLSDLKDLEHVVMDITPENIGYVERLIRPKNLMGNQIPTQKGRRHRLPDNTTPCPSCKLRNWKMSHNNHIKCRGCSVNYCFICREKIQGVVTSHFTPQGCPQHS